MARKVNTTSSDTQIVYSDIFNDFERLANHSQDAIYHFDIASQQFLFYNQRFRTFFQLDDKSAKHTTPDQIFDAIHAEDRGYVIKAFDKSLITGQTEGEAEYRILYPDGSLRWLQDRWIVLRDPKGEPLSFQGFIRDNTQQKLSELQFIGSRQNALVGSYIVQDGVFKYVNPQFISITGYKEEELIGSDSLALVHEDYREHVRQRAQAMLTGEDLTPYEFCVFDKSGATHWVMETVTSIIYKEKRAVLGYFMDITKIHEMKDNLSTLGLMLGTISHSLKGCLTGMKASLYLIETGFYRDRPAHIEEGLDLTKLMVDRVHKLILDILYYSKERKLEIEEVEVWQFAKEITILIENRFRAANIKLITHFPHDTGYFSIDREIIRTALINILENAMEACIEDTRQITNWIHFTADADDDNVYFEVSDNGPGIEKELAEKIFQLFSSSKGKRGTGIGLFVTRRVITKHGGTITVDSSPNEGSVFRITLPRNQVGN
ncbi:MAG: PAS domain-containing protein [Thermodesulfobacteriota bacterium]